MNEPLNASDIAKIRKAPIRADLSFSKDRQTYIPINRSILNILWWQFCGIFIMAVISHSDQVSNGNLLSIVPSIVLIYPIGVVLLVLFFPSSRWMTGSITVDFNKKTLQVKKYFFSTPVSVAWKDLQYNPPLDDEWDFILTILCNGFSGTATAQTK